MVPCYSLLVGAWGMEDVKVHIVTVWFPFHDVVFLHKSVLEVPLNRG